MTSRQGQSIDWSSYNYPTTVSAGSGSSAETISLFYGPNRQRWYQYYSGNNMTEGTYYIGSSMEMVVSGSTTTYRHYINAGNEPVAVYSRASSGNGVSYFLTDQQKSMSAITTSSGGVTVNESFTPYGNRRNPTTWSGADTNQDLEASAAVTRQAYTFQTQLGLWMGMNHMNGRVEDSLIGRFMSPDPMIQDPSNPQGYNRYSYAINNPVTLIDLTGFDFDSPYCINITDPTCQNVQITATPIPATCPPGYLLVENGSGCGLPGVGGGAGGPGAGGGGPSPPGGAKPNTSTAPSLSSCPKTNLICLQQTSCPAFSSLDPVIQQDVDQYNSDNGFSPQDPAYLDPTLVEAMVAVESGGSAQAYANDPMQVNNAGDWDPAKATMAGLTYGQPPGGVAGIQAGIAWLTYKAYSYNASGQVAGFRGWSSAVSRYNGGGDPNYLSKVQASQAAIVSGECP